MAGNIIWETDDFIKGIKRAQEALGRGIVKPIREVAMEILRLSTFEVPHDTGMLQASGHIEDTNDTSVIVGYNKVYAARLHENPQYHFQKGRKGKYLEDPIKNNLDIFKNYIKKGINDILK